MVIIIIIIIIIIIVKFVKRHTRSYRGASGALLVAEIFNKLFVVIAMLLSSAVYVILTHFR